MGEIINIAPYRRRAQRRTQQGEDLAEVHEQVTASAPIDIEDYMRSPRARLRYIPGGLVKSPQPDKPDTPEK